MAGADKLQEAIDDQRAGRLYAAAAKLESLVSFRPEAAVFERLGFVRHSLGELDAAATAFESQCRLHPTSAAAESNLATIFGQMKRYDDAVRHYRRALLLDADFVDARFNLAQVLELRNQIGQAIDAYRDVVARQPAHKLGWYRLGYLRFVGGFRVEAQDCYRRAIALDAEFVEARWALAMATLPLAYDLGEQPAAFYAEFSTRLTELDNWFANSHDGLGQRAVGNQQPYYIVYHDRNNRDVLTRYGDLCARLMRAWYGGHPVVATPHDDGPLNVTLVSGNVHDHAVWTAIVRGWCAHLDRSRFRLSIVYTDAVADAETELARSSVESFVSGTKPLTEWVDAIRNLAPDVLIYPEVGMDKMCIKLAGLRLAPVQVASWGHPETTGMPDIDYFLSAEAFEPPNAQENYRERLVPLAGIGAHYGALAPARVDVDLHSLGLDPALPVVLCPATPYKFLPAHDWTFAAIASGAGDCQFVFITDDLAPHLSKQLARRLRVAFEHAGLDPAHYVRFIGRQRRPEYFSLMRQSAVYLDTIVFSGFNTAMQAFECGLPVVTVEGRFLRSRFASGLLRQMGIDEL
ncbi:MAG: tetratricopeptide repeat protein, partial [Casimicrobiaceae bacterium]